MIRNTLIITSIAAALTSCGSGSISSSLVDKFSGPDEPTTGAATPEVEEAVNPYTVSVLTNGQGSASELQTETSSIVVPADFLFDTARTVTLKIDLDSATGVLANLSLCTDFEETAIGFDINYNSCPVKTTIVDGQFEHDMQLMNQYNAAVAVLWFPNQESGPIYQKFDMADAPEGDEKFQWLWN